MRCAWHATEIRVAAPPHAGTACLLTGLPGSRTRSCTRGETRLQVQRKLARPLTSWRSGGVSLRHTTPGAAPSLGQPRPIRRLGRAGRPQFSTRGEAPAQPSASAARSRRPSKTRSIWCAVGSSFTCQHAAGSRVGGWLGGWARVQPAERGALSLGRRCSGNGAPCS